jgi:hypothetical protein
MATPLESSDVPLPLQPVSATPGALAEVAAVEGDAVAMPPERAPASRQPTSVASRRFIADSH